MTGLALTFDDLLGWTLEPSQVRSGFDATVQCALVNIGSERGASLMHPEAGTTLLRAGVGGLMTDLTTTRHLCNFAAADTREFINKHTTDGTGLSGLYLQPEVFAPPQLTLNVVMVSASQEERGVLLEASI